MFLLLRLKFGLKVSHCYSVGFHCVTVLGSVCVAILHCYHLLSSRGQSTKVQQLLVLEIYLSLTNHPGQVSLAIPPWVGTMSTGQRVVMLCDWE